MRIRTVKPDFFIDRKVRSLEPLQRLLFIGLWLMADDEGRLEDDLPLIKGLLFPSDEVDVPGTLDRLVELGMLQRYEVDGLPYLHVRNFKSHQYISKARPSKLPPPPKEHKKPRVALRDESGTSPGTVQDTFIRKRRETMETKRKSFSQSVSKESDNSKLDSGPGQPAEDDEQNNSSIFKVLDLFFPRDSIEKLSQEYPPERLLWAAQRTRDAMDVREIKKPASYFLYIVRSDEQWERYVCDQYALGKMEARKRQREMARLRRTKKRTQERHERQEAKAAFQKYLSTVPAQVKEAVENYALREWARSNNIDLEEYRRNGWILKRMVYAFYREHLWRTWLSRGKPEKYEKNHIANLKPAKEDQQ